MCFDDKKVNEAVAKIKTIEEQCANQMGWIRSFRNKIFTGYEDAKSLEQSIEEKIVLADALVCQSFLTFLQNDFASYMKGGWTLRRAWKLYQQTHQQLSAIHKQIFGDCVVSGNFEKNIVRHEVGCSYSLFDKSVSSIARKLLILID
jgi:hypothetical protein